MKPLQRAVKGDEAGVCVKMLSNRACSAVVLSGVGASRPRSALEPHNLFTQGRHQALLLDKQVAQLLDLGP